MTPTVPTFSARFRCLGACGGEYPLTEVLVRCPTCDALLDVCHDERAGVACDVSLLAVRSTALSRA